MDALINVFVGLGIDQTVGIHFVIFVIVFLVLKLTFFNKLKDVIIYREDQTSNLIKNSEDINKESKNLEDEYQNMISGAYKKAQEKINFEKHSTTEIEDKRFKNSQTEILNKENEERTVIVEEIKKVSDEVLKNDTELSNQLVDRLIK